MHFARLQGKMSGHPNSYDDRARSGWRFWVLSVPTGPIIHWILLSTVPFYSKGTSPFDLIMLIETGSSGLVVYHYLPWLVFCCCIGAIVAWLRNAPVSTCMRWLAAPGFGLLCALFISFLPHASSFIRDLPLSYIMLGNLLKNYGANLLPFMVFLLIDRFSLRRDERGCRWMAVLSVALLVSYAMTYALVYPHVDN